MMTMRTFVAFTIFLVTFLYGVYLSLTPQQQETYKLTMVAIVLFLEFFFLYRMRKNSSGKVSNASEDHNDSDDEYHNDFTKVPSAENHDGPPRPVDYLGNIYQNNVETMKEDMRNIGIDPDKKK